MDRARLKAAIRQVETSGGKNNYPRLEAAFLPRGAKVTIQGREVHGTGASYSSVAQKRYERWGLAAACSFGPWQVLAHTAWDFGGFPEDQAPWLLWAPWVSEPVVDRLLERIISRGADTPEKVFNAWNTGRPDRPSPYLAHYLKAYEELG